VLVKAEILTAESRFYRAEVRLLQEERGKKTLFSWRVRGELRKDGSEKQPTYSKHEEGKEKGEQGIVAFDACRNRPAGRRACRDCFAVFPDSGVTFLY
jgi:hypothetical protein